MAQIPEKLGETEFINERMTCIKLVQTVDELITYLTAREELEDKRYIELTSRIDTIENQLEMKRGKRCPEEDFGFEPKDQPKRWRAEIENDYWYVEDCGEISKDYESDYSVDDFRYAIGNYHPTREAAEAYKAKLLADNAQV